MKITEQDIDKIKLAFEKMQTRQDFLQLLNFAKRIIYGENTIPFELKQLTYYIHPNNGNPRYVTFEVNKKSGAKRTINAPVKGLKAIQKSLSLILQCVHNPHPAAMGFTPKRSIVNNAQIHVSCNYVYNTDLKDFFTSIDQARVWKILQFPPFNLNASHSNQLNYFEWNDFISKYHKVENPDLFLKGKGRLFIETELGTLFVARNFNPAKKRYVIQAGDSLGVLGEKSLKGSLWLVNNVPIPNRLGIANMIASLCCTEMIVDRMNSQGENELIAKNVLPQGAPTSPILTNVICQRLDFLLTGVAKRFGLNYSRYADDITFSSQHNVYQVDSEFQREFKRIIESQNFQFNSKKTRLQKRGYRQEVTGLTVNDKVNTSNSYVKQLRMWLYYWERYGYEKASSYFIPNYLSVRGSFKNGLPNMRDVISGKLDFLRMVKGSDNVLYTNLKIRFDKLIGKIPLEEKNQTNNDETPIVDAELMKFLLGLTQQKIVQSNDKSIDDTSIIKTDEQILPIFHKPKELVALLKKFSVNNSALKYTTHSWDAGRDANMFKDLSEFLKIAESQYGKFSFQLNSLSKNLHGKINTFLFDKEIVKKGWGDINPKKRIYFGWSSPELLEACNNDISLNPEDFILPEKYQIQRSGKTLQKFKHIIDVFKNEIEVRDENSALLNLILQKHDHYLISFSDPKVYNLENKTFYTDIQWLGRALDLIFEGIQKYTQHPVVEYAVTESNNDRLVLTILHRNSFKNGLSIHDDKLNLKRGDFSTILDKLRNLCDWCIESEFTEGAYRINYLVSDKEIPAYEKIMTAEGFKHTLTFYK
jgi:RNA-directed DNA polymerase